MLIAQGTLGSIGVTAVAARRATGRRDLLLPWEAQIIIESWRRYDNRVRPHASQGYRPPAPEVFVLAFVAWPAAPPRPAPPARLMLYSAPTNPELTFSPDHPMGADQPRNPGAVNSGSEGAPVNRGPFGEGLRPA